ncbi:MAG: hypothetical protein K2Y22_11920 [Candidatus Obscuribacterales bacterium]|nr:hypothetical protein [Candidatus Obscuribacterales bacterium]
MKNAIFGLFLAGLFQFTVAASALDSSYTPIQGNVKTFVDLKQPIKASDSVIDVGTTYIKPQSGHAPPEVFRAWISRTHPHFFASAGTFPPTSVIEVKGEWDDAARTLRSLNINHTSIRRGKLKELNLSGVRVLVINCAGEVPHESYQKIRDFVIGGGYLLTTDWALDGCLQKVFPGYAEWNRGRSRTPVVDARLIDKQTSLVANTVTIAGWKLDDAAHTIRITKPSAVRVIAVSNELAQEDPDRNGILAFTFPFGRGKVMHMIGHFDNNAAFVFTDSLPDPAPQIGIALRQALATNFIVEGLTH